MPTLHVRRALLLFLCLAIFTVASAHARRSSTLDPDRWAKVTSTDDTTWYIDSHRIWCDQLSKCHAPVLSVHDTGVDDDEEEFTLTTRCKPPSDPELSRLDGSAVDASDQLISALAEKTCSIACRSGSCR